MSPRLSFLGAFGAAALGPAVVAGLTYWFLGVKASLACQLALAALALAVAHVAVLGVPAVIALDRLGWLTWTAALVAGLLIGGVPTAVWEWPLRGVNSSMYASFWNGHVLVPTMVRGTLTSAGWMQYARLVALAAALGAIGGGSFWWMLTRLRRASRTH